jgi:hypothetical protein
MTGKTLTPEAPEAPTVHEQEAEREATFETPETPAQHEEIDIPAGVERDRGGPWPLMRQFIPGTIINVAGSFLAIPLLGKNKKLSRSLRLSMILAAVAPWIYPFVIRPWHLRWGATDDEVNAPMPGDDEAAHPIFESTRAITINAPVEEVWPWLVQIGYNRAGFYSYDWLENIAARQAGTASGYTSVDYILPEFQDLKVGDPLPLAEGMDLTVLALKPHLHIVLAAHGALPIDESFSGDFSWVWAVKPIDSITTRLIMRFRAGLNSEKAVKSTGVMMEPMQFIMERKMLLGIKKRAEQIA